jgi:hypothetical protein
MSHHAFDGRRALRALTGFDFGLRARCPAGTTARGNYHTHPIDSTGFSSDDALKADRHPTKPYAAYVWLTGNGYVVRYESGDQKTITTIPLRR